MQTVRTALVGCGKVGQIHAAALRNVPESDFVAVCDNDPARATAFAERHGTRAYSDVGTMLKDAAVQAVFVCTPHPLHAAPVIQATEAGVHALVEAGVHDVRAVDSAVPPGDKEAKALIKFEPAPAALAPPSGK